MNKKIEQNKDLEQINILLEKVKNLVEKSRKEGKYDVNISNTLMELVVLVNRLDKKTAKKIDKMVGDIMGF